MHVNDDLKWCSFISTIKEHRPELHNLVLITGDNPSLITGLLKILNEDKLKLIYNDMYVNNRHLEELFIHNTNRSICFHNFLNNVHVSKVKEKLKTFAYYADKYNVKTYGYTCSRDVCVMAYHLFLLQMDPNCMYSSGDNHIHVHRGIKSTNLESSI